MSPAVACIYRCMLNSYELDMFYSNETYDVFTNKLLLIENIQININHMASNPRSEATKRRWTKF